MGENQIWTPGVRTHRVGRNIAHDIDGTVMHGKILVYRGTIMLLMEFIIQSIDVLRTGDGSRRPKSDANY
jgi:hypothetical protein